MSTLNLPAATKPRVVVVGGGFAGLNLVRALDTRHYQVVLFDEHNYHTFIPLLYQVATAGLEAPNVVGPLRAEFHDKPDFHFRMLRVDHIDPAAKTVHTAGGSVAYDILVLATGTRANFFGNAALAAHSLPLKTVADARRLRNHLFQTLERLDLTEDPAERDGLRTFLIVGGGPTGVELAGAISELRDHVLRRDYPDAAIERMRIILVEGGDRLLSAFSEKSSADARAALERMGVELVFGKLVQDYDGTVATFLDGSSLRAHTLIWGAGVTGDLVAGLADTAVAHAQYSIGDDLRVAGYDDVYALGDVAGLSNERWPKGHPGVAQVAIQMGERLARNLNRAAAGRAAEPFRYFDKGSLATIGRNRAVADLPNGWHFRGALAWFIWAAVHLFYLIGFRNRLLTFYTWVVNYFTYRRAIRLVMEPTLAEELSEPVGVAPAPAPAPAPLPVPEPA